MSHAHPGIVMITMVMRAHGDHIHVVLGSPLKRNKNASVYAMKYLMK